jgi:hypothetical protein
LIFHPLKTIFIAQRKCASGSVSSALGLTFHDGDFPEWHWGNGGVLSPEWYERPVDYRVFSVVRNPWDRFISGWFYCPNTRDVPMRDLLRHLPTSSTSIHDYVHITRPQRDILHDSVGNLVVHDLIRFEALQEGIDVLCDKIEIPRVVLPHDNPSPVARRHYREYFADPIDRDLFLRHFQQDVDTFEYEF